MNKSEKLKGHKVLKPCIHWFTLSTMFSIHGWFDFLFIDLCG